jgi:small-conductance mechanosensitive channel
MCPAALPMREPKSWRCGSTASSRSRTRSSAVWPWKTARAACSGIRPAGLQKLYRALPLYGVSLAVFLVIALLGHLIASWRAFWRLILPNPFLVELVSGAFRIVALLVALVMAMNVLGATTLMGTILGGAGVIGLAIGFSVRDTLRTISPPSC